MDEINEALQELHEALASLRLQMEEKINDVKDMIMELEETVREK